jgi:hypothetical protein
MTDEQFRKIHSVIEANVILPINFQGDRIDAARGAVRSALVVLKELGCLKAIGEDSDNIMPVGAGEV